MMQAVANPAGCFPFKVEKARAPLEALFDEHRDGCGFFADDTERLVSPSPVGRG
jgi:hypothetical protein